MKEYIYLIYSQRMYHYIAPTKAFLNEKEAKAYCKEYPACCIEKVEIIK